MINLVWMVLLVSGILSAAISGRVEVVTVSAISAAENAVSLSFKLIGVMCLWLGLMRIAEKAGVILFFSKIVKPVIHFLFPSVPKNHPAAGAIVLTLSANLLGLGNAVTPLGIKAMHELQKLNPCKEKATDAMCTFLALCTAGFTLVPSTMIAIRSAAGSTNPGEIIGATLLVSFFATLSVITADRFFRYISFILSRR